MQSKKKVFAIVGHSNWGKTYTIRALLNPRSTASRSYERQYSIKGKTFGIKQMSNDDVREIKKYLLSLEKMIHTAEKHEQNGLIITLCPVFDKKSLDARKIIERLKEYGELYFFILYSAYNKNNRKISDEEISILSQYGKTFLLNSEKRIDSNIRANEFKRFLETNI